MGIHAKGMLFHHILKRPPQYINIVFSGKYVLPITGNNGEKIGAALYTCPSILHGITLDVDSDSVRTGRVVLSQALLFRRAMTASRRIIIKTPAKYTLGETVFEARLFPIKE